nr:hypothetical protein CFP56_43907 [Quercus suber]
MAMGWAVVGAGWMEDVKGSGCQGKESDVWGMKLKKHFGSSEAGSPLRPLALFARTRQRSSRRLTVPRSSPTAKTSHTVVVF